MTGAVTEGARPDQARRHNRTAVLRRLHLDGPCTRAVLATELGLNRSTIKAVVDELATTGLVAERVPSMRSGAGRPSLLVLPQPHAAVVLAVDVQVEQVAMALVGLGGELLGRCSWKLRGRSREPVEMITRIVDSTEMLTEELGRGVVAAGVSVPGMVRQEDGLVREAPNLRWFEVPLGQRLAAALHVPVRVGNDAELGALAEHSRGIAKGTSDMVFLAADVGVGGGVISADLPLRGSRGYLGELGHMVVRPDGRDCYCGARGCWETEVGEAALCRALGLPADVARGVVIAELHALSADPAAALRRLGEFADWLTLGLVNVVNLLAPELVVLGDLLTDVPKVVLERVSQLVHERSLVSRAVGPTRIVSSALGRQAQIVGAGELAFAPILEAASFASPTTVG
jgi:predicted NBD/HSP70 family sugar kinase